MPASGRWRAAGEGERRLARGGGEGSGVLCSAHSFDTSGRAGRRAKTVEGEACGSNASTGPVAWPWGSSVLEGTSQASVARDRSFLRQDDGGPGERPEAGPLRSSLRLRSGQAYEGLRTSGKAGEGGGGRGV